MRREPVFSCYLGTPLLFPSILKPGFRQLHASSRPRRYCQKTQLPDSLKDFPKERLRHSHFGHLKYHITLCQGHSYRTPLIRPQVEGKADQWSDIDLAVFVEGLEAWDLHGRACIAAQVQRQAGDEVELHFFPARSLYRRHDASFAAWVLRHGVKLAG